MAPADDNRPARAWLIPHPGTRLVRLLRRLMCQRSAAAASSESHVVVSDAVRDYDMRPYLPPELVRIVASYAPAAAKCKMERVCREWRENVTLKVWSQALLADFRVDTTSLTPRPHPKQLYKALASVRAELFRGQLRGDAGGGIVRIPAIAFSSAPC